PVLHPAPIGSSFLAIEIADLHPIAPLIAFHVGAADHAAQREVVGRARSRVHGLEGASIAVIVAAFQPPGVDLDQLANLTVRHHRGPFIGIEAIARRAKVVKAAPSGSDGCLILAAPAADWLIDKSPFKAAIDEWLMRA